MNQSGGGRGKVGWHQQPVRNFRCRAKSQKENIPRVRNCPGVTMLNSLCGFGFVFLYFLLFVFCQTLLWSNVWRVSSLNSHCKLTTLSQRQKPMLPGRWYLSMSPAGQQSLQFYNEFIKWWPSANIFQCCPRAFGPRAHHLINTHYCWTRSLEAHWASNFSQWPLGLASAKNPPRPPSKILVLNI